MARRPHPLDTQVVSVLLAAVGVALVYLTQRHGLATHEALTLFAGCAGAAGAWLWGARGPGIGPLVVQVCAAAGAWLLARLALTLWDPGF